MTQPELIELVQEEGIGPPEIIALRRAVCGFIVHPDGTEEQLPDTCEHLRTADQRHGTGGNFIDQAKQRVGAALARQTNRHWCGACGCVLAAKTKLGFDRVSRQPAIYERGRCPHKKW